MHQLVGHGYALEAMSDGDEALSVIETHCPHAVVVGLEQGRMGSLELIERGRALAGRQTGFIFTTR